MTADGSISTIRDSGDDHHAVIGIRQRPARLRRVRHSEVQLDIAYLFGGDVPQVIGAT